MGVKRQSVAVAASLRIAPALSGMDREPRLPKHLRADLNVAGSEGGSEGMVSVPCPQLDGCAFVGVTRASEIGLVCVPVA